MNKYNLERILSVHHWTDKLFSFTCTRNKNFKFINGEFTLVGLNYNKKPLTRAYSIVSSNYDKYLEFLSIKMKTGALTSKLKDLMVNDEILVGKKSTGTLVENNLMPGGEILWLISAGTGISPFISILKNYNIYNDYRYVILIHSVRKKSELVYRYYINNILLKNYLSKYVEKFIYYPLTTKEYFYNFSRITKNINNFKIFYDLNISSFDCKRDRLMICGSLPMITDIIILLKNLNFTESKINYLGNFVIERAFVE